MDDTVLYWKIQELLWSIHSLYAIEWQDVFISIWVVLLTFCDKFVFYLAGNIQHCIWQSFKFSLLSQLVMDTTAVGHIINSMVKTNLV